MQSQATLSVDKIAVFLTVAASYGSLRGGLEDLARMARHWAIGAGASLAAPLVLLQAPSDVAAPGRSGAGLGLFMAISAVATYALVTRSHRRLILNQSADATRRLSVPSTLLYIARCSLLIAIAFGIAMLAFLPLAFIKSSLGSDHQRAAAFLVFSAGALLALLVAVRASLILPAAAIGDYSMSVWRSVQLTRGSSLRLAAGMLLSAGPAFLLGVVFRILENARSAEASDAPSYIVLTVVTALLLGCAAIVEASFLSFCNLHFTRQINADQAVQAPPPLPR